MVNKITESEIKTIIVRLLWGIGFFYIALSLREFIIDKYGSGIAFLIGIAIVFFVAYKYDLRFPYWLKDGGR